MSDGIAGRIDEMGTRIDELDKSITQASVRLATVIAAEVAVNLLSQKVKLAGIDGSVLKRLPLRNVAEASSSGQSSHF